MSSEEAIATNAWRCSESRVLLRICIQQCTHWIFKSGRFKTKTKYVCWACVYMKSSYPQVYGNTNTRRRLPYTLNRPKTLLTKCEWATWNGYYTVQCNLNASFNLAKWKQWQTIVWMLNSNVDWLRRAWDNNNIIHRLKTITLSGLFKLLVLSLALSNECSLFHIIVSCTWTMWILWMAFNWIWVVIVYAHCVDQASFNNL